MNALQESIARFNKLALRERLLVGLLSLVLLYLIVNLALLKPQQTKIRSLQQTDSANRKELASINKTLAILEQDAANGVDLTAKDRTTLNTFKAKIAEANAFIGKVNTSTDTTTVQLGTLVKELLNVNPEVTLLSLKTLPVTKLLSPSADTDKATANEKDKKVPHAGFEIKKTIFKHGVEIRVKGNYMALLSYMKNLQEYSTQLFWAEAKLDASTGSPDDVVLTLVLHSLSDQPASPLL